MPVKMSVRHEQVESAVAGQEVLLRSGHLFEGLAVSLLIFTYRRSVPERILRVGFRDLKIDHLSLQIPWSQIIDARYEKVGRGDGAEHFLLVKVRRFAKLAGEIDPVFLDKRDVENEEIRVQLTDTNIEPEQVVELMVQQAFS